MADMASFFSRPFGLDIGVRTAEAAMVCLPDEAIEKSVNGRLRNDPCRCRFTDHSQALDETDENSSGTRRLDTISQLARCFRSGKCTSHPSLHGFEKAADATINVGITSSQFHGRGYQQASAPTIGTAVALNVAGKVGPQAVDRLSAGVEFDIHPCQSNGNVAVERQQEQRVLVTERGVKAAARE